MIDFLATDGTRDIVITNGIPQLVTNTDQIAQAIRLTLLTFQGEWFVDLAFGVPWYARVLGQRFNAGQIQLTITEAILGVDGVVSITEISAVKSGVRSALVTVKVLTTTGEEAIVTATVP